MKTRDIAWDKLINTMREALAKEELPSVTLVAKENNNPFRVLVSTMISLRTKDEVTFEAFQRLNKKAPTPEALAQMDIQHIEELIYPAGFYKTKAKSLKKTAEIIVNQFQGKVPQTHDELLSLPGVGRKTANLVLNLGFNIPAICVDIHVHRISNRLGWVNTKAPDETEIVLMEILPQEYWIEINELLVKYGQTICTPTSPWCSRCNLQQSCPKTGVTKSR